MEKILSAVKSNKGIRFVKALIKWFTAVTKLLFVFGFKVGELIADIIFEKFESKEKQAMRRVELQLKMSGQEFTKWVSRKEINAQSPRTALLLAILYPVAGNEILSVGDKVAMTTRFEAIINTIDNCKKPELMEGIRDIFKEGVQATYRESVNNGTKVYSHREYTDMIDDYNDRFDAVVAILFK